jgi:hypothetical protein
MNNFYFSGLTVESQTYNAGDTLIDFGNDTTVENDNFEGTTIANQTTNPNVFDMRVINVCGPVPTTNEGALAGYDTSHFSYGNTVNNVTVSGDGSGGADDLDFSCERDGTVSNITDDGWGTALYEDYNTTVTGYHFTPGFRNPDYPGFYITDSSGITINNFTSSGEGGIIAGGTIQGSDQTTFNTTIKNEKMTGSGFKLTVNDSDNTTINDSLLGNIGLYAPVGINGLRLSSTTSGAVTCSNAENITDLTGLACP